MSVPKGGIEHDVHRIADQLLQPDEGTRKAAMSELLEDDQLLELVALTSLAHKAVEEMVSTGRKHDPVHLGHLRVVGGAVEHIRVLQSASDHETRTLAQRLVAKLDGIAGARNAAKPGASSSRWSSLWRFLRAGH